MIVFVPVVSSTIVELKFTSVLTCRWYVSAVAMFDQVKIIVVGTPAEAFDGDCKTPAAGTAMMVVNVQAGEKGP